MFRFLNKKYKVKTEKEQRILNIVTSLCSDKETDVRIDPLRLNVFISNKEKHYDVVLLYGSVIITNTSFSLRESFEDSFIDSLKKVAYNRASKDREEVLESILGRENEMLNKIEKAYEN